jgi:FkbM family methyltransferase
MLQSSLTYLLRNTPYFRGKPRLAARLVPPRGERCATIFGLRVPLDLSDVIQRDIYTGIFEPAETRFVKSFLKPGMTFVDVGANVGYYTWLAASLVRESGRVLAFEPAPYAFHRLKTAMAWNHVFWTACHNVALSDQEGGLTLYIPPESRGNHNASAIPYCEGMTAVSVPSTTLDRALETAGLERIDLLKADIEGHESAFLRGAERTARAGGLRAVLCEFNQDCLARANSSPAELEAWFASHGFECVREFPSKWACVANRLFIYQGRRIV